MSTQHQIAKMRARRATLDIVLALIGAIGVALLVTLLVGAFVENAIVQKASASASYLASAIALWLWLRSNHCVSHVLGDFRGLMIAEFVVFGVVGIVVSLSNLVHLFS